MSRRILVGKVASAHGIKGDLKVICYAEDADLLFRDAGVYTSETTPTRVVLTPRSEPKPNLFIARMTGIADRNAAEAARNTRFYIDREDMPEPDADSVYLTDLEGMDAVTPEGKALGRVLRVQNFGASDLLEIQGAKDSYYIPFCEPYLVRVDMDARRVIIHEPEVM